MKKIVKLFSLIFAFCLIASPLGSCSKKNKKSSDGSDQVQALSAQSDTHYANIQERDDYLVHEGKTEYTIVYPEEATDFEADGVKLLVEYFEKALGVTMPTVSDAEKLQTNGKYISVGDTILMRNSGISVSEEKYGSSGFRIVTKGNAIYISGARNDFRAGTYYGVQEFLYHTVNWRAYSIDEIRYDVKESVKMADYDVVEIPDFDNRRVGYHTVRNNAEYARLMRNTIKDDPYTPEELALEGHSYFQILPPATYFAEHSDWYWYKEGKDYYTDSQFSSHAQLCLSNQEMTEQFAENLTQRFIDNPTATFCHLGAQDNVDFCYCKDCTAVMNQYGTNAAGLNIMFINKVARIVTENIAKIDPARKLYFETFAYYDTCEPPVNEVDGEYVADCAEVIPDDNVYVQFTPLGMASLESYEHESNKEYLRMFLGWSAIAKNISVWQYNIHFPNFEISTKNWDTTAETFRFYRDHGVKRVYDQGPIHLNVMQMVEMRIWIESKLMWNANLDWQTLAEEFIANFYGDAAEEVLEAYNVLTTYCENLRTTYSVYTQHISECPVDDERYWSFSYVESIRMLMEQGFEKLEPLKKKDPVAYETYYWRLGSVYFENMYMQLQYYPEKYATAHKSEIIAFMEDLASKYNITYMGEVHTPISGLIEQWKGANGE